MARRGKEREMNIWRGQKCFELYTIPSMSWLNISCFPEPDITYLSAVPFNRDKIASMGGCINMGYNSMFKKLHAKFVFIRVCDPSPLFCFLPPLFTFLSFLFTISPHSYFILENGFYPWLRLKIFSLLPTSGSTLCTSWRWLQASSQVVLRPSLTDPEPSWTKGTCVSVECL